MGEVFKIVIGPLPSLCTNAVFSVTMRRTETSLRGDNFIEETRQSVYNRLTFNNVKPFASYTFEGASWCSGQVTLSRLVLENLYGSEFIWEGLFFL